MKLHYIDYYTEDRKRVSEWFPSAVAKRARLRELGKEILIRTSSEIEVPTDKKGLIGFLNTLGRQEDEA